MEFGNNHYTTTFSVFTRTKPLLNRRGITYNLIRVFFFHIDKIYILLIIIRFQKNKESSLPFFQITLNSKSCDETPQAATSEPDIRWAWPGWQVSHPRASCLGSFRMFEAGFKSSYQSFQSVCSVSQSFSKKLFN